MKEKLPLGERPEPVIVGRASPEKKKEYKEMIRSHFGEGHYDQLSEEQLEKLKKEESEKTPAEKRVIEQVNELTNNLLNEAGAQPFDIPERNIHIISQELYQEIDPDPNQVAITIDKAQAIAINGKKVAHSLERAETILHEMVHLKSYLAYEAAEDLEGIKPFRGGLRISASRRKQKEGRFFNAFHGLNEAVVSEIGKTHFSELVSANEFLKKERDWQDSAIAREAKETIAKDQRIEDGEVFVITEDGENYKRFPYYEQRRVLNYIVDQAYEDNKDRFKTRDEAMKVFFQAHFNGKLLPAAHLIENSFGDGAFKMVGTMDKETDSARMVLDDLMKRRRKITRRRDLT